MNLASILPNVLTTIQHLVVAARLTVCNCGAGALWLVWTPPHVPYYATFDHIRDAGRHQRVGAHLVGVWHPGVGHQLHPAAFATSVSTVGLVVSPQHGLRCRLLDDRRWDRRRQQQLLGKERQTRQLPAHVEGRQCASRIRCGSNSSYGAVMPDVPCPNKTLPHSAKDQIPGKADVAGT